MRADFPSCTVPLLLASSLLVFADCGTSNGKPDVARQSQAVLDNYATNLYQAYSDSVVDEQAFSATVEVFLGNPTDATLAEARTAWLASRAHYMLTEGARFYDGPIDIAPPNHEAAVNSWPLDEAYVDYTTDSTGAIDDTSGVVNNPAVLVTIDVPGIDALNAQGGDENISNGYHAIEFLLWGQALQPVGPGQRPATDYMVGGPRPNVDRRTAYLRTAIQGVIEHLTAVRDAWAPGAAYRTSFVAGGLASVASALTGMGRMSKGELAGQRIDAAYASKSRRDQHDCFSSNTLTDYGRDAAGLQAIYLGNYGLNDGPGFDTLVKAADATVDQQMQAQLQTSVTAVEAVPPPFESAIQGDDTAPGRVAIRAAVTALRAQGDGFADAAAALGLQIAVPEENN